MNAPTIYKGLENIYVDETSICNIDGMVGSLSYRDHSIDGIAKKDFVDVIHLLINKSFPSTDNKKRLDTFLRHYSILSEYELSVIKALPTDIHPMLVLQSLTPVLNLNLDSNFRFSENIELDQGLIICAKLPTVLATYYRLGQGEQLIEGDPSFDLYKNFLYQFTGRIPTDQQVQTLRTAQILQMEHGFNASTFTARVVASTLSPIQSCVSAAIGSLFGKLHGGADQAALEMAMEIAHPDNVEDFVLTSLREKKKIMGMGHRVYKVIDPRAVILKPMARELCLDSKFERLYLTLEKIEEVMNREMLKKGKDIKANVEFYKGAVFYALGFPTQYFTSLFAIARSYGYLAHVLESRIGNKLIRPKAFYISEKK